MPRPPWSSERTRTSASSSISGHSRTRGRDLDARPPPARVAPHPPLVASGLRRACGGDRLHPNARRLVRYRERGCGVSTPPYRRGLHVLRSWPRGLKPSREVVEGREVVEDGGGRSAPNTTSPILPQPPEPPQTCFLLIHNSTSCGWARQW